MSSLQTQKIWVRLGFHYHKSSVLCWFWGLTVFTARRYALSALLSVALVFCIESAKNVTRLRSRPGSSIILASLFIWLSNCEVSKLSREPIVGVLKYAGKEKFDVFGQYLTVSWKRWRWNVMFSLEPWYIQWPWATLFKGHFSYWTPLQGQYIKNIAYDTGVVLA